MERLSQLFVTYLINSAWQVPLVCVLAFVGSLILRRTPSKWSHLLWTSALLTSSLLPLWSLRAIAPEPKPEIAAENLQTEIAQTETPIRASATARRPWFHLANLSVRPTPRLVWMIAGCYCIFLLYRGVRLALAAAHAWNLRALAVDSRAHANLRSIVERYSARLRLRGSPAVFLTDSIGPLTVGIRRPILLMPSAFCETASEAELNAAVCHELAHIKRHDFLLNLICESILLPVCYHPLAALIKTRIDRSRELACDDMAAELMTAPAVYARSLVSIAKSISTSSVPRLSCGQGLFDTEAMEERIMNLLGNRPIVGKQWAQALAVTSVALLGVISAAAGTFSVQVAPQTAPMITSAGATPQLPSQQNGGGTEMPASEAHVTPSPVPLPSPQPAQEQDLPGYYKTGNGVSAPIAIEAPPPQYDSVARAAKAEGVGIFQVGVGADGTVQMVRPVSGLYPPLHPSLIQSGVDTIRTWKFDPALKDGHPVPVQVKVEINFRLH